MPMGRPLAPVPTPEWKRPSLASVYAITKYVQERLTLTVAPAYGMEGVALRLFNVYGPGQALSNPYTGVLAIFASRLLNGERPLVFEDGEQRRDFVHVEDVARAFVLALEQPRARRAASSISAAAATCSIREVGDTIAAAMGREHLLPEISARRGSATFVIASRTSARAGRARLRADDAASRTAWANSPPGCEQQTRGGPGRRGAARTGAAGTGGMSEPVSPSHPPDEAGAGHRRRRFHRLQSRRPAGARMGMTS